MPSRGKRDNMSENCEVEMLVGGGLDYGMKMDQDVSVNTMEQKRDEKHKGESNSEWSETHISGDEGLGCVTAIQKESPPWRRGSWVM